MIAISERQEPRHPEPPAAVLPEEAARSLVAAGRLVRYPAGAVVQQSDAAAALGVVLEGTLRAFVSAPDGRQAEVEQLGPHDIVGLAACFAGGLPVTVETVTETTLVTFSPPDLTTLMELDPTVAMVIARQLGERVRCVCLQLQRFAFAGARRRLAAHLLALLESESGRGRELAVTQQELANAVGTVREHIARLLGEFRREGLVATGRSRVIVTDPKGLRRTAAE